MCVYVCVKEKGNLSLVPRPVLPVKKSVACSICIKTCYPETERLIFLVLWFLKDYERIVLNLCLLYVASLTIPCIEFLLIFGR